MSLEIEVDQLADFLFIKNSKDAIIDLELGGIEDNKDLFYFCLDLFCKGLILLFGKDNSLIIEDISQDQFMIIKQKLSNAGIGVSLDILELEQIKQEKELKDIIEGPDDIPTQSLYPYVDFKTLEYLPNNLSLSSYYFDINLSEKLTYRISFDLFHRV